MAESDTDSSNAAVAVVYILVLFFIPLLTWWLFRQLVARPFLHDEVHQPNLVDWSCCSYPPKFRCPPCTPQPEDEEAKNAWIKRWKFHGVTWLVFLVWFMCLGFDNVSSRADDNPTFAAYVSNHLLGVFIIAPWSIALTDFCVGSAFLYCHWSDAPLPNTRKGYEWARWLLTVFFLFTFSLIALSTGYQWGRDTPRVVTMEIPLARLPKCLDGFKAFLVTDVHVGSLVKRDFIEGVVAEINKQKPDIVLHAGDGGEGLPKNLGPLLSPYNSINTSQRYFVTGNHEYFHGNTDSVAWEELYDEELGFTVLNNESVELASQFPSRGCGANDKLRLVGIPDISRGSPDLAEATKDIDSVNEEWILLSHQPNSFDDAINRNVGLQISGHVHAGQSWPIHPINYLANQGRFSGLLQEDKSLLYVSNGQANWGPRLRLFSRPENTVLILRHSETFEAEGKVIDLSHTAETNMAIVGLVLLPLWILGHLYVFLVLKYAKHKAWWLRSIREIVPMQEEDGDIQMQSIEEAVTADPAAAELVDTAGLKSE